MPDWLRQMLGGSMPTGGGPGYPRSMAGQSMGYPAQGGGAALAAAGPPAPGGVIPANLTGIGNPARMAGGRGGVSPYTFNGDVGYDSPGPPGPGAETRGYLDPPTIEGSVSRPAIPGGAAGRLSGAYQGPGGPEYLNPQSLSDLVRNPGAGISSGPQAPAGRGAGRAPFSLYDEDFPRNWADRGASAVPGLSLGGGHPAVRAAVAAAAAMAPTSTAPPAMDELPRRYWPSVQDPTIMAGGPGAGAMAPPQGPPGYLNSTGATAGFDYPPSTNYPTGLPQPPQARAGAPANAPLPPPRPAAAAPVRTRGAPNLGYYQGNNRFPVLRYDVPGSGRGRGGGPPISALNLASLFGGR